MLTLPTTTVTIERPSDADPYETPTTTLVAAGLAAHISQPTGNETDRGGQTERIDAVLLVANDETLLHTDLITDDTTGDSYRVAWVKRRVGLGLDHTKAGLVAWSGGSNG
jgi:hypothetical protein